MASRKIDSEFMNGMAQQQRVRQDDWRSSEDHDGEHDEDAHADGEKADDDSLFHFQPVPNSLPEG